MRRLYAIDGIRGAAALIVAAYHFFGGVDALPAMAVDTFFLLSGFVMARTYEVRMRAGLSAVRFVGIRYRRLFLPLFVGTTIGLAARLITGAHLTAGLWAGYGLALAFMPTFWLSNAFWFNLPAWSLFLEIIANWLHGLLFGRWSNRPLIALLILLAALAGLLFANGLSRWGFGILPIVSMLPRELAFYIGGIVIFRTWGDRPFELHAPAFVERQLSLLGALSYPLYATHHPVLLLLFAFGVPQTWAFAAALVVAILLAVSFELCRSDKIEVAPLARISG